MKWQLPEQKVEDDILDYLLTQRGITDRQAFLNPSAEQIHPSHLLYDTAGAAKVIIAATQSGKRIFVHGDFDVDGVCATAIMWDFLYRKLDADVLPYIPSRFDEGYGLSPASLDSILTQGGELVITVDCGIKNIAEVLEYTDKGLEFVITDHHSLPEDLKELASASAIVHPHHPDGQYPFGEICGAAVAWKTCCAIAEALALEVDMHEYLDLVALATICDVMPLSDENRAIVALGLKALCKTRRPGLLALYEVASVKAEEIQSYHPGFVLGPRLNAAGRIDTAMEALRLLTTQDMHQARDIATQLNALNSERQQLTQDLITEAESLIATLPVDQLYYFIHGEGWAEGIVGLVAGRLTEKYSRPVLVASSSEGIIKGSARSISQFHIADALKTLDSLLLRHGGHAQAAGFSLALENKAEFELELAKLVSTQLSATDLEKLLKIDVVIKPEAATLKLVHDLEKLEPFGFGNPKPVFALLGLEVSAIRRLGQDSQHLKLSVVDSKLEIMAFNAEVAWQNIQVGDSVDIAGSLGINEWNGRESVQLVVKDMILSADSAN